MIKAAIKHQCLVAEFFTAEGCYITELSNSADDPDLSIARARVAPGVTTRWHRLAQTAERYYIVQGTGSVEIEGLSPTEVKEGDIVIIPAMCRQRITNTAEQDLIFLAICTPRFQNNAYLDAQPPLIGDEN